MWWPLYLPDGPGGRPLTAEPEDTSPPTEQDAAGHRRFGNGGRARQRGQGPIGSLGDTAVRGSARTWRTLDLGRGCGQRLSSLPAHGRSSLGPLTIPLSASSRGSLCLLPSFPRYPRARGLWSSLALAAWSVFPLSPAGLPGGVVRSGVRCDHQGGVSHAVFASDLGASPGSGAALS